MERFAEHAAMALRADGLGVTRAGAAVGAAGERRRRAAIAADDAGRARSGRRGAGARRPAVGARAAGRPGPVVGVRARRRRRRRASERLLTARERGLVCALVAVYRRRRARSRHLGRPGGWLDTVVVVERIAEQPSTRHGTVRRHDLVDVAGNRLVWWQTRGAALPLGQAVHLRGRVERHTHVRRRRGHGAGPLPTARSPPALRRPSPARVSFRQADACAFPIRRREAHPRGRRIGERALRRADTRQPTPASTPSRRNPLPRRPAPAAISSSTRTSQTNHRSPKQPIPTAQTLGCRRSRRDAHASAGPRRPYRRRLRRRRSEREP